MTEMKKMKESSMYGRENRADQNAENVYVTRQIRMLSEFTEIQMISNEHSKERFCSYANAMNALRRK